jgi:iron donor protein CyaY
MVPSPSDFAESARRALLAVESAIDALGDDLVDTDLTEGVLTIEFESGESFVLNVHGPANEIWLSANRRAWHFAPRGDDFVSTAAGAEPLLAVLSELVGEKLGRRVVLAADPD